MLITPMHSTIVATIPDHTVVPMSSPASANLFQPLQVGEMELTHRVVMAPLTRLRAADEHVPGAHSALYYAQRATVPGTLIIAEASLVPVEVGPFNNVPYISTDEQISGWKEVVDAVHAKGSFIYLQLAAIGRVGGLGGVSQELLSASDIPMTGLPAPLPLTHAKIEEFIEAFATSAYNAVHKAGFDGVEVHGANGYLIDQFTQSVSNNRTDVYGGSVANRSRFMLEVISAVARKIGQRRTAARLSPWGTFQDMLMTTPERLIQFSHLVDEIKNRYPEFAYLHLVGPRASGAESKNAEDVKDEHFQELETLRKLWGDQPLIIAGGLNREMGLEIAQRNSHALVAYGRYFIANPDLVNRLKDNLPLNKGNRATYYTPGPEGYVDYPFFGDRNDIPERLVPALH
ncbi:hypothetical protein HWV62_24870 [Athelia sp. TMB]|nr:hypothetical protein HWV62_24870 [Athelia sp. TMB]